MKKIFMISLVGYLAYLYVFHVVFLPHRIYEWSFILISGISLLGSFYFYEKKKRIESIISIIIYALSFSLSYLLQVFIKTKNFTIHYTVSWIILIFSILSLIIYFYYFMRQIYLEEINEQNYIRQIEKEIYENYIHILRHDYNQKLHQITNDIQVNDQEKALNHLKQLMQESYQNNAMTISNSSSLNHMFQSQLTQYQNEGIPFQYFLCKVEYQNWNEKYTIFIYQFLEAARIPKNEVIFYLQVQQCYFICQIISRMSIQYPQYLPKSISVVEKKLSTNYVYTIKMLFNS